MKEGETLRKNSELDHQRDPRRDNAISCISLNPEDKEFIETIRNARNTWKHQWLPPCLARHARKESMERLVVRLTISSQILRVSWEPVNPQECVWKKLYRNIKIGENFHIPDRRWTNQNPWRRSGTENIHLDTAATNSRRGSR